VFLNDYGNAGKYTYYTGEMAHSYNTFWYQNTQHDLWPIEENFRGKPAMIISEADLAQFKIAHTRNGAEFRYRFVDDFQAYSKVEIRPGGDPTLHCSANTPFKLPITLISHYDHPIFFKGHTELSPVIAYYFFKGPAAVGFGTCDVIAGATLEHELSRTIELRPPAAPGEYKLRLAIQPGWLPPSNNGGPYAITVGSDPQASASANFKSHFGGD
jgi:hypothetical protein